MLLGFAGVASIHSSILLSGPDGTLPGIRPLAPELNGSAFGLFAARRSRLAHLSNANTDPLKL